MNLLKKIKDFFKRGNTGESQRDRERREADERLNEYLAEKNQHDRDLQQKLYNELHARDTEKERHEAEQRLTESLKKEREHESIRFHEEARLHETKKKNRVVGSEVEPRIIREEKDPETKKGLQQREEDPQKNRITAEEQQKRREEQKIKDLARMEEERKKADERKRLEQIKAEEEHREAVERNRLEKERLVLIHSLYEENFHEYLHQAELFRKDFGKNIQCDVCGNWKDTDLIFLRKQTYCEKCLPPSYNHTNERKVRAGSHGASNNFIKK